MQQNYLKKTLKANGYIKKDDNSKLKNRNRDDDWER